MTKDEFLDEYIFKGLKNLNDGFDAPSIKYFSLKEFEIVLLRVEQYGLFIHGIEPWKDGDYYTCWIQESYSSDTWYKEVFQNCLDNALDVDYSATYGIPNNIRKEFMIED